MIAVGDEDDVARNDARLGEHAPAQRQCPVAPAAGVGYGLAVEHGKGRAEGQSVGGEGADDIGFAGIDDQRDRPTAGPLQNQLHRSLCRVESAALDDRARQIDRDHDTVEIAEGLRIVHAAGRTGQGKAQDQRHRHRKQDAASGSRHHVTKPGHHRQQRRIDRPLPGGQTADAARGEPGEEGDRHDGGEPERAKQHEIAEEPHASVLRPVKRMTATRRASPAG